jgi:hypothetical protein
VIQNREVEVSTLVLDGTIGFGAIPENEDLSATAIPQDCYKMVER